jgi:hypothetical protein
LIMLGTSSQIWTHIFPTLLKCTTLY